MNTTGIRNTREQKRKLGQRLLTDWAIKREADLERTGAQANRSLERARQMQDGIAASTTAHDKRGMPLLNSVELAASKFGETLSVGSWVADMPRELRSAATWNYLARKTLEEIGDLLGMDRKAAGNLVAAAEVYIAERMLETRSVNDPSFLLKAL